MSNQEKVEYINEYREALGYEPFRTLSASEISYHLRRIRRHAPYGNDPWMEG